METNNLLNKLNSRSPGLSINHTIANLWRRILKDLGITERVIGLLANYNKRYRNSNNSKELINSSTMKSNCFSDEISLKSLIGLLTNLLNVRRIDITITITHHNGECRSHSETLFDKTTTDKGERR